MGMRDRVSTGHKGFDLVIDDLRLGDNVVWQTDLLEDYKKMAEAFVSRAKADHRNMIYIRFGNHEPFFHENDPVKIFELNAQEGFESFTSRLYSIVAEEGKQAFYIFDCLSDLLEFWHSDLMIRNFFKIMCPFLFELDTVAYFSIRRSAHTYSTVAGIRETTQLLLDLYHLRDTLCIHPLKVWQRYSPTMFLPHRIIGEGAQSITSSAEAAELFANMNRSVCQIDHWLAIFERAANLTEESTEEREQTRILLISMLLGSHSRMFDLCRKYFSLDDLIKIAGREIGTGFIGGKSVGMLVARKILNELAGERFVSYIEPHDSFYLGSDIFYSYIVQNGWWELRTRQKSPDGYFSGAPEFKEKLLSGKFSEDIQEQFFQMLEYFGQSPIIVRSSSLLEDNFGNAFAGKYDSVFCVNQGSPQERFEAFEQAVRAIYASTMNEDALAYRLNRGLSDKDEQMAILVQRVSGDYHGSDFYPHIAGVGNSSNLYVWDKNVDSDAGMLRLVFGLGTRAVDRTEGDYVKIVTLDQPLRIPPVDVNDQAQYSQHEFDLLSLPDNQLLSRKVEEAIHNDLKANASMFVSPDFDTDRRLRELGYKNRKIPEIVDFKGLLSETDFPQVMKDMLSILSGAYEYPVDIEFTANFFPDGKYRVNLLQCRPLQTKGLGNAVEFPLDTGVADCFFSTHGNFMGGNIRLPVDFVVMVRPAQYLQLPEQYKYEVARQIGILNDILKDTNYLLIGPGRWGTTTPSLGVPVRFSEICHAAVLCELSSEEEGFRPELSYGSHFFQDLVETDIFYAAIFDGQKDVTFHPEYILGKENTLQTMLPQSEQLADVLFVAGTKGMEIYSDVMKQRLLCK